MSATLVLGFVANAGGVNVKVFLLGICEWLLIALSRKMRGFSNEMMADASV